MNTKTPDDKDKKTIKAETDTPAAAMSPSIAAPPEPPPYAPFPPQVSPFDIQPPPDDATMPALSQQHGFDQPPCHPLTITLNNMAANTKAFIAIRDDQQALWSEGTSKGLVGMSIRATKDPTLNVSSFLVNARELYLQTNGTCQQIEIQLYVLTPHRGLRGRVDLPPNASVTLTSQVDRTSLIGLSSFAVDL